MTKELKFFIPKINLWPNFPRISLNVAIITMALASIIIDALTLKSWNFFKIYLIFWGLLLLLSVLVAKPRFGKKSAAILNYWADFLKLRGSFVSDALVEAPKFALIRIAFGLFMIERSIWVLVYLFPGDWSNPTMVVSVGLSLLFAIWVCIGFFTQLSLIYLVVIQWQLLDELMGTSTLGNDIGAMLALLLFVVNAGAHYSVDGYLRRQSNWIGRVISATYYKNGLAQDNVIQIVKFLTLLAYWLVCVYSLMKHLDEPSWLDGSAGPLVLTNNFMSPYFFQFQQFFELGPWAVTIGKISIWLMLPWYAVVLPFVLLGGLWRKYVIYWGVLFFTLSVFILQLGWLGEFEFLFWIALFWQSGITESRKSLGVAYDDKCNLCDRTINVIKFFDIFGRIELRPVSKNQKWLSSHKITNSAALQNLHGVEHNIQNRVSAGYDFYLTLSRSILLMFPAYPFLVIGKWTGIGPTIYRTIASRRIKLFGICKVPTAKPEMALAVNKPTSGNEIIANDPFVPLAYQFLILATFYFLYLPIPPTIWNGVPLPKAIKSVPKKINKTAHIYGITPINVFNKSDLRLAENWFTLAKIDGIGTQTLLPVFRENGTRLSMHKSDRIYFGFTSPFRRNTIGRKGCFFDEYKTMAKRFARYDNENHGKSTVTYVYKQYLQLQPDVSKLLAGKFVVNKTQLVCTKQFNLTN